MSTIRVHQFCREENFASSATLQIAVRKTVHPKMSRCQLLLLMVAILGTSVLATEFIIQSNHGETIWMGSQGNDGKAPLQDGGWVMEPGASMIVTSPEAWAGRFWARTGCVEATGICETGNCGELKCQGKGGNPPVTLIEITLKGDQGQDFYDVSLVDGFNIPASIEPTAAPGEGYRCVAARCEADVNANCPDELRQTTDDGRTVGCKSACLAFNTDEYCCRNANDQPGTCDSKNWEKNYPKYFKDKCPDAYSYAYDDNKSTFTCENTDYKITFG